ncbi:hypothetical protein PR202_gb25170 [Eleusine coracana subsp. coracana]|uniref:CCHC-type domain-containing protein n=1 Tax=Eleusine coracana subsp. coracana TaxID=191504 RepID=A0AAV5FNH5_ELECO|nr:hypothetical protein PR202_gb25170 [Eleusine coracana subsp. coracana]
MEVEVEVELSRGAVAAISRRAEGLRPVLQVADSPRLAATAASQRCLLLLSDGVHTQRGALATCLTHLVRDGDLRRGTVVRVLDYVCTIVQGRRVIVVIQLEILQTDCTIIGSPTMHEATPTQPYGVSCSGGLVYHEPCVLPVVQRVADNLSCFSGRGMLDSSFAPRAKHAAHNLQYSGCYGSVLPQNTVDAKMQQLSLDDHQTKGFRLPPLLATLAQISEIENMELVSSVDFLGVVTSISPSATVMRRDGTGTQKRKLQLKDTSGRSMDMTWGKFCDREGQKLQCLYDSGSNPILAVKGCRIGCVTRGRYLITVNSTKATSSMIKNHFWKTIAQIKDENLGRSGKPGLIAVRAAISHVNADKFCYPACTLNLNDVGVKIIGCSAQELLNLRDEDEAQFFEILQGVCWQQYLFKLRVKEELFYDDLRVMYNIVSAEKLNASATNDCLLEEIDNLMKDVSHTSLEEDASCYTPNIGSANLEVKKRNAYDKAGIVRGAGYGHSADELLLQGTRYNSMSAPLSGLSERFTFYDGVMDLPRPEGNSRLGPCLVCRQHGHLARDCTSQAT